MVRRRFDLSRRLGGARARQRPGHEGRIVHHRHLDQLGSDWSDHAGALDARAFDHDPSLVVVNAAVAALPNVTVLPPAIRMTACDRDPV
jgi:hypothetical protein